MPRIFITVMAIGFIALVAGLVGLYRIISIERIEAIDSVNAKQASLEQNARRKLEQVLISRIREARETIQQRLADPLAQEPADAQQLLFVDQGKVVLPAARVFVKKQHHPSAEIYRKLLARRFHAVSAAEDSPWKQRIKLYEKFVAALKSKDKKRISDSFRKILLHRSRNLISAQRDIPYMLALLDYFSRRSNPEPRLMVSLLRDGLQDSHGRIMIGLQRHILLKRSRFDAMNFDFLVKKTVELSRRFNIPFDDFKQLAFLTPRSLPDISNISQSAFIDFGRWYVEPETSQRLIGLRLSIDSLIEEVESKMRSTKQISSHTRIKLGNRLSRTIPLSDIRLVAASPEWGKKIKKVHQRYYLKSMLIIASGLFALAMIILAALHQYRKQKYLALKSDFLSAISHELRTPLTSIRLLAETLEYRLEDIPEAKDYPTRIVRDIDGLSLLVENILSYNRLQKDQWVLHKSVVDIPAIVDSIHNELHLHTSKKVRLDLEHTDCFTAEVDSELLKLLIFNLVRNACHYNANSEVKIRIQGIPGEPGRLLIRDNGIGIDPALWKKVFNDFFRIQKKTQYNIRGSGLGLSICKKIMTLHGGRIRIARSDARGTTFELRF